MADLNDLQEAVRAWQMAFKAMSDYFKNHDILDPACLRRWTELEAAQDRAHAEMEQLVALCRSQGQNEAARAKNTLEYKGRTVEVVSTDLAGGGHGFGLKIDGDAINRGGYDPSKSADEAIEEGIRWAKEYIDSLP